MRAPKRLATQNRGFVRGHAHHHAPVEGDGERPPLLVGLSLAFPWRAPDFLALALALRERGFRGHITAGGHFGGLAGGVRHDGGAHGLLRMEDRVDLGVDFVGLRDAPVLAGERRLDLQEIDRRAHLDLRQAGFEILERRGIGRDVDRRLQPGDGFLRRLDHGIHARVQLGALEALDPRGLELDCGRRRCRGCSARGRRRNVRGGLGGEGGKGEQAGGSGSKQKDATHGKPPVSTGQE
jgi:hypothetical protein